MGGLVTNLTRHLLGWESVGREGCVVWVSRCEVVGVTWDGGHGCLGCEGVREVG